MVYFFQNFSDMKCCEKNCFIDLEKLLKFKAKDQIFEINRTNLFKQVNSIFKQNAFLTCSWRFLRSNTYIRKIRIQIGKKMIQMYKPTGKVTKQMSLLENSKPDLESKSLGSDQVWLISGSSGTRPKTPKDPDTYIKYKRLKKIAWVQSHHLHLQ